MLPSTQPAANQQRRPDLHRLGPNQQNNVPPSSSNQSFNINPNTFIDDE